MADSLATSGGRKGKTGAISASEPLLPPPNHPTAPQSPPNSGISGPPPHSGSAPSNGAPQPSTPRKEGTTTTYSSHLAHSSGGSSLSTAMSNPSLLSPSSPSSPSPHQHQHPHRHPHPQPHQPPPPPAEAAMDAADQEENRGGRGDALGMMRVWKEDLAQSRGELRSNVDSAAGAASISPVIMDRVVEEVVPAVEYPPFDFDDLFDWEGYAAGGSDFLAPLSEYVEKEIPSPPSLLSRSLRSPSPLPSLPTEEEVLESSVSAAAAILGRNREYFNHPQPLVRPPRAASNYVIPPMADLALGQLTVVNSLCAWCKHSCDYGVKDTSILLPTEAFPGYCNTCHTEDKTFMEEWTLLISRGHLSDEALAKSLEWTKQSDAFKAKNGQNWINTFDQAHMPTSQLRGEKGAEDFISQSEKITGRRIFGSDAEKKANGGRVAEGVEKIMDVEYGINDITQYQAVQTCRGSLFGQVDCRKARICEGCLDEKLEIVNHRRHTDLTLLTDLPGQDVFDYLGNPIYQDPADKRCMLCVGMATHKCNGCPLRLCGTCQTFLSSNGKGFLNNVIYTHKRSHIRNDAFLLRSDGGGF